MTLERIAELRALCDAATRGPWHHTSGDVMADGACLARDVEKTTDAAIFCAARAALPEALDEIERLRTDLAILSDDYRALQGRAAEAERAQISADLRRDAARIMLRRGVARKLRQLAERYEREENRK